MTTKYVIPKIKISNKSGAGPREETGMTRTTANGIEIEYESFGAEGREVVLLIMGHTAQLTKWPIELCEELVHRGYRVVRFDNRDCGLSTKLDHLGLPDWEAMGRALAEGRKPEIPYHLDDMAADAVGLLDSLGIKSAHIVGASLGGMISHLVAADYPERTRSLTSIMCTPSRQDRPLITPEAAAWLASHPAPVDDEAAMIDYLIALEKWLESPAYPTDDAIRRADVTRDYHRGYSAAGVARQGAASSSSRDRCPKLRTVKVPATVMHGAEDPGAPLQGAYDIAECLADCDLRIIPGMGHDFHPDLTPFFADAICSAADRARAKQTATA